MRRRNGKYNNRKVVIDNILFDSKAEAKRYSQLAIMQRAGLISQLERQPEFKIDINGTLICRVILDFSYRNKDGKKIYEDVKGKDTALSRIKRKLVEASHRLEVEIVRTT